MGLWWDIPLRDLYTPVGIYNTCLAHEGVRHYTIGGLNMINRKGPDTLAGVRVTILMICLLLFLNLFGAVEEAQESEGDGGSGGAAISLASWKIEGVIDAGYAQLTDTRELYNPGDTKAAVNFLWSIPVGMDISSLEVTANGANYPITKTESRKSEGEIKSAENKAFACYLDKSKTAGYLAQLVEIHGSPSFFSLQDERLLICQFPMNGREFLSVTVHWQQTLKKESSLNTITLPLAHAIAFEEKHGVGEFDGVKGTVMMDISSVYTLEGIYSPTHDIKVSRDGLHSASLAWEGTPYMGEQMELYYTELSTAFGGGFLNYRLPGKTMFSVNEDGYFMFLFAPNTEEFREQALPKDIVFVIDCSGSMSGEKIEQARNALKEILGVLAPGDRFTILKFSSSVSSYNQELIQADEAGIEDARSWASSIRADGSTNINDALLDALDILGKDRSSERPQEIIFLTDGMPTAGVTNNDDILASVRDRNIIQELGATLYVFGVGYDVNTYLLDRLSSDAGGSTHYIQPGEDIKTTLTSFYDTIACPVLTNISVEMTGINVTSMFPRQVPALYKGGELNIVGMYTLPGNMSEKISIYVNGTTTTGEVQYVHSFDHEEPGKHSFLPRIYATRAVGELLQDIKQNGETTQKVDAVTYYGKRYGIETPYTTLAIQEDFVFDSDGFRELTGQSSVQASQLMHSYSHSKIAGVGLARDARMVGDRTFINLDGIYVETALLPDERIIDIQDSSIEEWLNTNIGIDSFVRFASPDYFELAEDDGKRQVLALGPELVFRDGEEVMGVTKGNLVLYITNLSSRICGENVSICWETCAPASSVLHYREWNASGAGEWLLARENARSTEHNITIPFPEEGYEFFVESVDDQGNMAVKDNDQDYYAITRDSLDIITGGGLQITSVKTNIGSAAMRGQTVIIKWTTNFPADGFLYMDGALVGTILNSTDFEISVILDTIYGGGYGNYCVPVQFEIVVQTEEYGHFGSERFRDSFSFKLDVVTYAPSVCPSFDAGFIFIMLSVVAVSGLSVVLRARTRRRRGHD